jgi:nucleotide-binding universal stress UspA family protein
MLYKDVLFTLNTYPEPTPVSAVDDAVSLSLALGARISALACEVKIAVPGSVLGHALLNVPAMIAAEARKSATNAEKLLAAFQETAERNGVFQERLVEQCLTSEVPNVLIEHARLRDLTIIPVAGDQTSRWYAESIIFGSGRPAIILPHTSKRAGAFTPDTVILAWDFGRAAARTVADALPILGKAKRVFVVTVTNEKVIDTKRSGAELAKHLARHGVNVVLDVIDAAGRSIGDALESHVASRNGDLLVMGAYGHSRLREFILGGATKSMLARPPVPIFLSH